MPRLPQPPVISPSSMADQQPETPFMLETVRRTMLKFAHPFCQPSSLPDVSEATLAAIQHLVEVIKTLRISQPSFLAGVSSQSPRSIEALLPYVSEEAYDVLDALQNEEAADSLGRSSITAPHTTPNAALQTDFSPLLAIETLIPSLLWQIARSDYNIMHLIEGVKGQCWQEQGWVTGMLRLVVMLELEAPTVRWCFDLATGHPTEALLESIATVQADELLVQPIASDNVTNDVGETSCQVKQQIQAILHLLQTETIGLKDFLQGVAVELLQPGSNWQSGTLQLRFGFEFSAQVLDTDSSEAAPNFPDLIEAELMEEEAAIARLSAMMQVSVVNVSEQSLGPATLIRASDGATLDPHIQQTTRQQIAQSLCSLGCQPFSQTNESEKLIAIVQVALIALAHQTTTASLGLQQPTLLLDELAPKLLWSLTSGTYEMTQLLGGLPVQALQPGATWQQGTLRLLAVLQLTATDLNYTLDLSTGRSVPVNAVQLAEGTIVQSSAMALCQQPILSERLMAHLRQQLCENADYKVLANGLAIHWLADVEQDWQSGTMTLSLSLGFSADAL